MKAISPSLCKLHGSLRTSLSLSHGLLPAGSRLLFSGLSAKGEKASGERLLLLPYRLLFKGYRFKVTGKWLLLRGTGPCQLNERLLSKERKVTRVKDLIIPSSFWGLGLSGDEGRIRLRRARDMKVKVLWLLDSWCLRLLYVGPGK